jgi:hypothetical protein
MEPRVMLFWLGFLAGVVGLFVLLNWFLDWFQPWLNQYQIMTPLEIGLGVSAVVLTSLLWWQRRTPVSN